MLYHVNGLSQVIYTLQGKHTNPEVVTMKYFGSRETIFYFNLFKYLWLGNRLTTLFLILAYEETSRRCYHIMKSEIECVHIEF
jgi:hypothetical protein